MNKRTTIILSAVIGLLVIGGGTTAFLNNQNDQNNQEQVAMEKSEDEAMMKKDDAAAMEAEKMAKDGDAMKKDGEAMEADSAMAKHGAYVSLSDYNNNSDKYADSKTVYFFHASWCPICRSIDEDLSADTSQVPTGVTIVKTDFDSETDLRKKYGVTTQYTFVQVDSDGNEVAQWSATSLQKAIDGIEI